MKSIIFHFLFLLTSTFSISIKDHLVKTILVKAHNQLRREVQPPASNMKELEWSKSLQQLADFKIQECRRSSLFLEYNGLTYGYTSKFVLDIYKPNLTTFLTAVQDWFESSQYYDMNDNQCTSSPRVCGNYIQAAWANSSEIGCAYNYCRDSTSDRIEQGVLLLCLYYSGMDGDLPYIPGKKCSICPNEFPQCDKGLCSKVSATPSVVPYYSAAIVNSSINVMVIVTLLLIIFQY